MKGIVLDLKDITDSREVMESKESPKIRWFIYIIVAVIIIAIVFSCFFDVDEYSRVTGEIKTSNAVSSVTSLSGGKLKEILVVEGQSVVSGDVLFVLDSDYAQEQKSALEEELLNYQDTKTNTELLKKCIEDDTNYFEDTDSEYYYRYEQYKNSVLLNTQEIESTKQSNNQTLEENERNLETIKDNIEDINLEISEYNVLLKCIKNDTEYMGNDEIVSATYDEYATSYEKYKLIVDQYQSVYEELSNQYDNQSDEEIVTSSQVETAKQEADLAYSNLTSLQSDYLQEICSQISTVENQLLTDSENVDLQYALAELENLKNCIEQGYEFVSDNATLQESYNQYVANLNVLLDTYNDKNSTYQDLYNTYVDQSSNIISESDVSDAKYAYDAAVLDLTALKNSYVSQILSNISSLESELETLKDNQVSIEEAIENTTSLDEYEQLSNDNLKNEAIITLNSELDSIDENIASIELQIIEVNETIDNAEIVATLDGTVTLVEELCVGDIVQAGSSLCSVVPNDEDLKVTLYIPEDEISKIEIGQTVEYVLDAIPYTEYGEITGEIYSISADSIIDESTGEKYYIAQANLSTYSLSNKDGDTREVKNGMLVEAKTIYGSKKAIVWLLEKINLID